MQIETAKSAIALASQIEALQALVAMIDVATAEKWSITVLKVSAPATGASYPAGTTIDLLPAGHAASDENSQMALAQAQKTYVAQLAVLTAQLEAL